MLSKEEILSSYPWVTKDLFTEIIRKDENDDTIEITDFVAVPLPPGENYLSIILRVAVNYVVKHEKSEKRFLIKAAHMKKEVREMFNGTNLFERETTMYLEILPKVQKMLADVGDNSKLSAKCYKASCNENEEYLIFEDLKFKGYEVVDRRLGLNMAHFKRCLSKFAKWHAATAVLLESTNYKEYPKIREYLCLYKTEQLDQMTKNGALAAAELTKSIPGYEHLSEKIIASIPKICSKTKELLDNENGSFFTLCHGDSWMNNILFHYDEYEQPSDAILVDFQCPYRGPAIVDVVNCLYSSSEEGLEEREWEILIQYYHMERSEMLKKLGYNKPLPSLNSTQIEYLEKGQMFAGAAFIFPGGRLFDYTEIDLSIILGESEENRQLNLKLMSNPKCRKTIEFLLDFFNRKGYFD